MIGLYIFDIQLFMCYFVVKPCNGFIARNIMQDIR